MLRFVTAGESHGKGCTVIIEGIPSHVPINLASIQTEMQKRRHDSGRGGRGILEPDEVEILSGVRFGYTLGTPITLWIKNNDFANWEKQMAVEKSSDNDHSRQVTTPRPGHADLAGALKYGFDDVRNVLERASARETTGRVAAGAIFKQFLQCFSIELASHTVQIGSVILLRPDYTFSDVQSVYTQDPDTRCIDKQTGQAMKELILETRKNRNTLGGVNEIWAVNVPVGLGSHVQFNTKIDGQIAQALMSIPSVKAVEIGSGIDNATQRGSDVHDEIFYEQQNGYFRKTNRAGGIEGGITNGMPVVCRVYHKPISTLYNPLQTVDIKTKKPAAATIERSDVCVVPRAGVIAESMLAYVLAKNMLLKFGHDSLPDILTAFKQYQKRIR